MKHFFFTFVKKIELELAKKQRSLYVDLVSQIQIYKLNNVMAGEIMKLFKK